jgi:hypothetical protein
MNQLRTIYLSGILLFCAAGPATAVVIDFEDIVPVSPVTPTFGPPGSCGIGPIDCDLLSVTSEGFIFEVPASGTSNFHAHLVSDPFNAPGTLPDWQYYPTNDTQYIGLDAIVLTMQSDDGLPFDLATFDAAEGFLIDPDNTGPAIASLIGNTAAQLEVVGNLSSGGAVSAIFDFDGVNDSILGGSADFETFILPATFSDLASVTFTAINATGAYQAGAFSIDNLSVSTSSSVPEPGTAVLFLCGLAVLWARRIPNIRHLSI